MVSALVCLFDTKLPEIKGHEFHLAAFTEGGCNTLFHHTRFANMGQPLQPREALFHPFKEKGEKHENKCLLCYKEND